MSQDKTPRNYLAEDCDELDRRAAAKRQTTGWQPIETAPRDCSIIEIRYTHGAEPWGFSCSRSPDGVFRDLEGNPLSRTPDEWREEQP